MIPVDRQASILFRQTGAENAGNVFSDQGKPKVSSQPLDLFDLLGQHRNSFEEISNNAVIRYIEDWSFGIFIDSDNRAGVFHAYEMLDGTGNPKGHIKLWSNGLPGGANLPIYW